MSCSSADSVLYSFAEITPPLTVALSLASLGTEALLAAPSVY